MRSGFFSIIVLAGAITLAGCENDTDQYSGLSELVAERHEVRKNISEENAKRKKAIARQNSAKAKTNNTKASEQKVSSTVLYEKQIDIIDSESRIPLAKGVAYMNKSGQIVRIKVFNTK